VFFSHFSTWARFFCFLWIFFGIQITQAQDDKDIQSIKHATNMGFYKKNEHGHHRPKSKKAMPYVNLLPLHFEKKNILPKPSKGNFFIGFSTTAQYHTQQQHSYKYTIAYNPPVSVEGEKNRQKNWGLGVGPILGAQYYLHPKWFLGAQLEFHWTRFHSTEIHDIHLNSQSDGQGTDYWANSILKINYNQYLGGKIFWGYCINKSWNVKIFTSIGYTYTHMDWYCSAEGDTQQNIPMVIQKKAKFRSLGIGVEIEKRITKKFAVHCGISYTQSPTQSISMKPENFGDSKEQNLTIFKKINPKSLGIQIGFKHYF
jgi:hypothetical protein